MNVIIPQHAVATELALIFLDLTAVLVILDILEMAIIAKV